MKQISGSTGAGGRHTIQVAIGAVVLCMALALASVAIASPAPTDNVYGTVRDGGSGMMLADAYVELIAVPRRGLPFTAATVRTDADGEWSASVPDGRYRIKYSTSDGSYAPLYYPGKPALDDAWTIDLGSWLTYAGDIGLQRAAALSGGMTDMFTDVALTDAEFVLIRQNETGQWRTIATGTSDSQGRFSVDALNPGDYKISAHVEGSDEYRFLGQETVLDSAHVLTLGSDQTIELDFKVNTDIAAPRTTSDSASSSLPRMAVVRFSAVDEKSGVAATYYRINRGRIMSGTAVTLTRLGFNTIEFYSVDGAGNIEATQRRVVLVTRTRTTRVSGPKQ